MDAGKRLRTNEILIGGFTITMQKHQVLAAYWMLSSEASGCPGGFESDDMGYGKVYCLR